MTDAIAVPSPATPKDLRNFGFTFASVALVFGAILLWKGRPSAPWFLGAAVVFFLVGAFLPSLLRPAFGPWMKFAEILGYVNTRILLGLFFVVGMTPTGLLMRLTGKDPMTRTFKRKSTTSYWAKPTPHADGDRHFTRQF
ncbi:MAG: SxtJ family membrane protein [Vicinamibacteria bacterium]